MSDFALSREALLHDNPVGFEADLNYPTAEFGDPLMPAYNGRLLQTGVTIGWTALEAIEPGAMRLYNPRLEEDYRDDHNLHVAFVVAASGLVIPGEAPARLYSGHGDDLSRAEEQVWESLVDLALAEPNVGSDLPDYYRLIQAPEARIA